MVLLNKWTDSKKKRTNDGLDFLNNTLNCIILCLCLGNNSTSLGSTASRTNSTINQNNADFFSSFKNALKNIIWVNNLRKSFPVEKVSNRKCYFFAVGLNYKIVTFTRNHAPISWNIKLEFQISCKILRYYWRSLFIGLRTHSSNKMKNEFSVR